MQTLKFNEFFFKRSAIVFFIALFVIGCFVFSDYGISCDEKDFSRLNGEVSYNFIKTGDATPLLACNEKYHGPAFEIFLYSAEKILNVSDSRNIYLLRHLLTFLIFFTATIFFYLLGFKFFKSHGTALLCSIMLVASPRIFAEGFYNSKDLVMLSFCIIASYTAFLFVERQTLLLAIVHAAICGFTMDIRIMGLLLPLGTLYLYIMQKDRKIIPLLMFIFYTLLFTIAFWPVLWIDPVYHFFEALREMSHFPIPVIVFYFGEFISSQNLPWHYVPVWISITTPVLYIVLFIVGIFFLVKNSLVNFMDTLPLQFALFMFATPVFAIIILNSAVYDSYRHIFFIYPFLLLIAVYGFTQLIQIVKKLVAKVILYSTAISILFIFVFMIVNHPFQNVYFNFLAGKNIRQNFELDYWGLSFKQGLEYILATDKSKEIYIAANLEECLLNFSIIPVEERKRLIWTYDSKSANYYLTNFRYHPADYYFGPTVFQIKVGAEKIMEVQKLK